MTELLLFIIVAIVASFIINSLVLFSAEGLTSHEKRNIAILSALIIIPTWIIIFFIFFDIYDLDYIINNTSLVLLIYFVFSFLLTFLILRKVTGSYTKNIPNERSSVSTLLVIINAVVIIGLPMFILSSLNEKPRNVRLLVFKSETSSSMTSLVAMCDEKDIVLPDDTDITDFVSIKNQGCGSSGKGVFTVIAKWKMEDKDCIATITERGVSFSGKDC